jgi:hypothetical protein
LHCEASCSPKKNETFSTQSVSDKSIRYFVWTKVITFPHSFQNTAAFFIKSGSNLYKANEQMSKCEHEQMNFSGYILKYIR